jgi:hypothetical protein
VPDQAAVPRARAILISIHAAEVRDQMVDLRLLVSKQALVERAGTILEMLLEQRLGSIRLRYWHEFSRDARGWEADAGAAFARHRAQHPRRAH